MIEKRNNVFKKKALVSVVLCLFAAVSQAQLKVVKPGKRLASAVAIIVDADTYAHLQKEVTAYKEMLETKELLSAYVVINNWKKPDEVKDIIVLIKKHSPVLEGVVLVGDIPVPMIRNAQHTTSAFKMDEIKFPIEQSSVASDRFYDDTGLSFRYLKQDEKKPLWHYYELHDTSRQVIQSDLYSARILSHKTGAERHKEIGDFLMKAVEARKQTNPLDNVMAFTGNGYNSESLTTWRDDYEAIREMFPVAFTSPLTHRYLNYRMSETGIKYDLFSELGRPDLDLALFTEHGDVKKQYLSQSQEILTRDLMDITPQAKAVIFNACYNGSFHQDSSIANGYIFGKGKTLVAHGNTVNVLQDKWTFELMGLLQEGVRIGNWAALNNTLESHLIGDPTFRFNSKATVNEDLIAKNNDLAFWKKMTSTAKQPVLTALSLKMRFRLADKDLPQELLRIYKTSPSMVVRMECVNLLFRTENKAQEELVPLALKDNYELIRRKAADWISYTGNNAYAELLTDLFFNGPNDERVLMSIEKGLGALDMDAVRAAFKKSALAHPYFYERDKQVNAFIDKIERRRKYGTESLDIAENPLLTPAKRIQSIRTFRNYNMHSFVPKLLTVALDTRDESDVRQHILEALGWFSMSNQKQAIITACLEIIANDKNAEVVKNEARQTIARLKNWTLI